MRGQRLYEISDPIRATEMWVLNDQPSIRFVRDALFMRRADTIDLVLSRKASTAALPSVPPDSSGSSGYESESDGMEPLSRMLISQKYASFHALHG